MELYSRIRTWRPSQRDINIPIRLATDGAAGSATGQPAARHSFKQYCPSFASSWGLLGSNMGREDAVARLIRSTVPPRSFWRLLRTTILSFATILSTACVTVDHNAAETLGTAGMKATEVLSAETRGAVQTLGDLNQWWHVEGTLVCVNAKKPDLRRTCIENIAKEPEDQSLPQLAQIIDILNKQKQAIDTLNQAYAAFVDLAQYNAGQEAAAALKTSFSNINSFLGAVSTLQGVSPIPAISSTLEKFTGGAIALIADSRENAQILAANKDLRVANEALYQGLNAETSAMSNLLSQLQVEGGTLFKQGVDAGLISPLGVLAPVFSEAYPGIQLQSPPKANQDVVRAAATVVVSIQDQQTSAAVVASHQAALLTLQALQAQHAKLESKQGIDIAEIKMETANLKADVAQMTATSASAGK